MRWHVDITDERSHDTGMQRGFTGANSIQSLTTSRDKVNEVFSMLRYDVLISEDTDQKLRKSLRTDTQRLKVLSLVSSYIDQAENFYNFARGSDYRSAALLYYYSFLNLAKAAIVIDKPSMASSRFEHGLYPSKRRGDLKFRSLIVKGTQVDKRDSKKDKISVYNELYKLQYGKNLPNEKSITLQSMFGYLTDVRFEVKKLLNVNQNKIHECKFHILGNTESGKSWVVLATKYGFYPANYPNSYSKFEKNFERFTPSPLNVFFTYEMKSFDAKLWNFSHSKKQFDFIEPVQSYPLQDLYKIISESFELKFQDDVYDPENAFLITDPLNKDGKYNFNELMAIYSFMFYLSNTVRYYPNEFNERFTQDNTEGWLIKSFIEAAPFTALLHLTALISGNKYRLLNR